jgi:GNAT superfamily N-acetyltransferase
MSAGVIDIRHAVPTDAWAIAGVHVDAWRATYAGIVAQSYLDELSVAERAATWERHLCNVTSARSDILVAEAGGEIIGFVAGGPRRQPTSGYDAQLHALYMKSELHGHGTGRRLAQAWATVAIDRGLAAATVHVLARNSARGFYEHLGARYLEDIEVAIGGDIYTEACYGWADLRALAPQRTLKPSQ